MTRQGKAAIILILLYSGICNAQISNSQGNGANWRAKYDLVRPFANGKAVVKKGWLFGAVDSNGKEILQSFMIMFLISLMIRQPLKEIGNSG